MVSELNNYICDLDDKDKQIINNRVAEKGIEGYLTQQLVYLDCSRIINNMRMMQTIGYPYQREITSYLYALSGIAEDPEYEQIWLNKLFDRHNANLEYEKSNPPIWYGGKKAKDEWNRKHGKHPRKRKVKEQSIPGMSNVDRLNRLSAEFGKLTFKLKKK